jgi:hypothetical protein
MRHLLLQCPKASVPKKSTRCRFTYMYMYVSDHQEEEGKQVQSAFELGR